jgi:hypothetical protein
VALRDNRGISQIGRQNFSEERKDRSTSMQFKNMLQRSLKWVSFWRFLKRQKSPSILSVEANKTKSIDEKPGQPALEQLHVDLRRLEWALALSEETLTAITKTADWVEFHTGQVVIDVDSEITHMYSSSPAGCSQRSTIRWVGWLRQILSLRGVPLD